MRCEEVRDLLPLHALGILEESEAEQLRKHLASGCPGCAAELAAFAESQAALPFALEEQDPSPAAKDRLLAAVREDFHPVRDRAPAPRWGGRFLLAAAASTALIASLALFWMSRHYELEANDLRARIRAQNEELARLGDQVRRTRDTILLVRSPGSKVIDLAGQGEGSSAAARVFWDVRKGVWRLYADNLPPLSAGKTYQLWLITPRAKVSAGIFNPEEEISGTVNVPPDAGAVVAAAVTPEPAGGSPQPTGAILLLGKI